jgi:hypothetical protein
MILTMELVLLLVLLQDWVLVLLHLTLVGTISLVPQVLILAEDLTLTEDLTQTEGLSLRPTTLAAPPSPTTPTAALALLLALLRDWAPALLHPILAGTTSLALLA